METTNTIRKRLKREFKNENRFPGLKKRKDKRIQNISIHTEITQNNERNDNNEYNEMDNNEYFSEPYYTSNEEYTNMYIQIPAVDNYNNQNDNYFNDNNSDYSDMLANENQKRDELINMNEENESIADDNSDHGSDLSYTFDISANINPLHQEAERRPNYNKLISMISTGNNIDIIQDALKHMVDIHALSHKQHNEDEIISNFNKAEIAKIVLDTFVGSGLNIKQQSSMCNMLSKLFPTTDWPFNEVQSGDISNRLKSYLPKDYRTLEFDICPIPGKNCVVFYGKNDKLNQCPVCSSYRYRKCKECKQHICNHSAGRNKVAYRRVFYRPLVLLVYDLLREDTRDNFLKAINYVCPDDDKYFLSDVRTANNYKRHMNEMKVNYDNWASQSNIDSHVMVNLCISQFYDGVQIRKNRHQSYWPLLISILNLPPNMRIKFNVGTFLITTFTATPQSPAERFILEDCLSKELLQFYEGFEFTIDDVTYFVQIRLISTILDTIACQEVLGVQATGSFEGCCFCKDLCKGFNIKRDVITKGESHNPRIYYFQHRQGLPFRNQLREIGQTCKCCPPNFYKRDYKVTKEMKKSNEQTQINPTMQLGRMSYELSDETKFNNKFTCLDIDDKAKLYEYLNDTSDRWDSPNNIKIEDFSAYLYYEHCDYRPEVKFTRKSNEEYIGSFLQYLSINEKAIKRGTAKSSLQDVNGVKGMHPFYRLPYLDFATDFAYDGFHSIKNLCTNIMENMEGLKIKNDHYYSKYLKHTKCHDNIYNSKFEKEKLKQMYWYIDKPERQLIDVILNEIRIPTGISSEFQLGDCQSFAQSGFMRGVSKMQFITVGMKLVVTIANFNAAYSKFFLMLSDDINSLLSPFFNSAKELDLLYDKLLEMVVLWEGLFPVTESKIVIHQLPCISKNIINAGIVKCFWALPGERSLSTIKKYINEGGMSFDKSAIFKISMKESIEIKQNYGKDSTYFKTLDINENLSYSDQGFHLEEDKTLFDRAFNAKQINDILVVFICEIKKNPDVYKSSNEFQQLFLSYKSYRTNKIKANKNRYEFKLMSFYEHILLQCESNDYAKRLVSYFHNDCTVKCYKSAEVYGTNMRSTYNLNEDTSYDLKKHWNDPVTYSSWFKFHSYLYENDNEQLYSNLNTNLVKENYFKDANYKYGQFKYYFKIGNCDLEPSLNSIYFASIIVFNKVDNTHIKFKNGKVYIDMISLDNDIDNTINIISLYDVFSSRILTCGVDKDFLPIKVTQKTVPKEFKKVFSKLKCPYYLLVFEMNANRKNINTLNYGSN
jgi:hypothetical protein